MRISKNSSRLLETMHRKAQAFKQRHARPGLGQHAAVEGEQAEFAVEIVLGREAGVQVGGAGKAWDQAG
jgi:hypothetical protein